MTTHKPFRELIKPGTNFEFVGRTRLCDPAKDTTTDCRQP